MNLVDLVVVAVVALAAIQGLRLGAVVQVLSFGGFLVGLYLGALLASVTVHWVHSQPARTTVALVTMLGIAAICGLTGRIVGSLAFSRIHKGILGPIDSALGVVVAVIASLLVAWLLASTLINSSSLSLNTAIDRSTIIRSLDNVLPAPPSVFSRVQSFLSAEGFPPVFAQLAPASAGPVSLPGGTALAEAVAHAGASTVKVIGDGCGQIQEGSGFIVAPGLVVTNAHVVAGIPHPVVEVGDRLVQTTVLTFDPSFDLAVMRVRGVEEPALALDPAKSSRGAQAAVLGFPGGGPFRVEPAGIMAEFQAEGRDIYGQGLTIRDVYEIQAIVRPGNSGGPLVEPDGKVVGVVFSRSTTNGDIGYALASPGVLARVVRAANLSAPVSTSLRGGLREAHRAVPPARHGCMALSIEDYGIIGDLHTVALVGRDGSIDWLCLPRFDSAACFAKLLGDEDHGSWRLAPKGAHLATHRHYRGDTLVLETEFVTEEGSVRVVDCMPIRQQHPEVVRLVEGVRGKVTMEMELTIRFGYGQIVPWVQRVDGTLNAIAGPDGLSLWTPVQCRGQDLSTVAEFTVWEGQQIPFSLTWFPASEGPPRPVDAAYAIQDTELWWTDWVTQCTYQGEYREGVVRSLITLKALTYEPTGGIVAAATTSLPETLGGSRNWDYRFCWLRDATLTLESLMRGGFYEEAMAWRNWLLRAIAGDPAQMQIMYGAGGERRLDEWEIDWLPGYERSAPVRIGNAAAGQFQLDVYGEVMSALYESSGAADGAGNATWELQLALMEFLEEGWREPDDGIWEVRGPRRHFTHSKVMAWVAIDRAIKTAEEHGLNGPIARWKAVRKEIHDQVCDEGFNADKGSFTQYYGSDQLDASLLMIPLVGFLPAHDPRVRGTIEAIEHELVEGGFVLRYRTADTGDVDGLSGREGAFLACSFWLADCLSLLGRDHDARQLLDRLMGLRNDLGLLSEEYDPVAGRLVGNFPQAFSHVSLVNSASKIGGNEKPSSGHVAAGLARRSLVHSKSRTGTRHMGVFNARTVLSRLVDGGDSPNARHAARVVSEAIGSPPAPANVRGRSVKTARPAGQATDKATGPKKAAKKQVARKAVGKKAVKPGPATTTRNAGKKRAGGDSAPNEKAAATTKKATKAIKAAATKSASRKKAAPPAKAAAGRS